MGKISQGILGGVSGKVGNIIGGNWKGIDYIRIKPSSVANPRTKGQVEQRTKFSTVLAFLQPMTDFLKTGFKLYSSGMTQFNAAMSYNLANAVTQNGTDIVIDYPNALVTRGNLTGVVNGNAVSNNPAEVVINWDDNSDSGNALASDKALIVALNTVKGEAIYTIAGPLRSAGTATMILPVEYSGDKIETYLGFISGDGSRVSNSAYLGSVTVA